VTDDRAYPTRPICGVGVIAFWGHSVALVQRGKEPRRGEWSIPGGAVELGESIREAAVREFEEECTGKIDLRDLVDAVDIITRDEQGRVSYHYVVADFWAEWKGGVLAPASDVMDVRWVPLGELEAYLLPDWTRDVVQKAADRRKQE
jgi:8-oxo-dGTP diphosphatase